MAGGRRPSPADLSQIPETAWTIANARFAAIEPLLDRNVSRPSVQEQACHVGVDVSTLYRWLKKFRKSHLVSDLLPDTRGVRHGDKRLAADAEGVVTEVIGKRYLNKQRWSAQKICDEVAAQCRERGIEAPHPNTVRRRIAKIPPQTKVREKPRNSSLRGWANIHNPNAHSRMCRSTIQRWTSSSSMKFTGNQLADRGSLWRSTSSAGWLLVSTSRWIRRELCPRDCV